MSMFEQCQQLGVAAITYSPVYQLDLSLYSESHLPEEWGLLEAPQKKSLAALAFQMRSGDTIYVMDGPAIAARGEVTGPYRFIADTIVDENGLWWSHTVPVQWDNGFNPVSTLLGAEPHTVLKLEGERLERLEAAIAAQSPPRALFVRVGWMKYYDGPREDDPRPIGGGRYNREETGHEVYNCHDINGYCYAFFEPPGKIPPSGKKRLSINRIARDAVQGSVDKVTVVFVATRPEVGGQVVVGWHNNATVFRECQREDRPGLEGYGYYSRTRSEDIVVLPVNERIWEIPSDGSFTHSNVCYVLKDDGTAKGLSWQQRIINEIRAYSGPNAFQNQRPELEEEREMRKRYGGQGYGLNAEQRKAVEDHAMKVAERYFAGKGYDVKDEHKTASYDFLCTKDGQEWYVEVKGTTSRPEQVLVTRGEVDHARNNPGHSILFVVHEICLDKGIGKTLGGKSLVLKPWCPGIEDLEATAYQYRLPK